MRHKLTALFSAGLFMVASTAVSAETINARFASVFPASSVMGQANAKFAERVKEATGGKINIAVYPDGQLGGDEAVGRELSRGLIEFSASGVASWRGMNPMLDIHHLPYLISTYDMADRLLFREDSMLHKILSDALLSNGMRSLAFYELDFRAVTNSRKPVRTADDLKGLKLRVPPAAPLRAFFEAAGSQGVTLPFPELFVALQQGTVDGQDNGPSLTYSSGLYEAQKHMTLTNHSYEIVTISVSEKFWEKLTSEQQEAMSAIAKEVAQEQIKANRLIIQEDIDKMRKAGVEVIELTDEERRSFIEVGRSVWDQFTGTYGEDTVNQLKKEVSQIEG